MSCPCTIIAMRMDFWAMRNSQKDFLWKVDHCGCCYKVPLGSCVWDFIRSCLEKKTWNKHRDRNGVKKGIIKRIKGRRETERENETESERKGTKGWKRKRTMKKMGNTEPSLQVCFHTSKKQERRSKKQSTPTTTKKVISHGHAEIHV